MQSQYKKAALAITIFIAILSTIYLFMLNDIEDIYNDFYKCIKGHTVSDELKDSEFYRYYNHNEQFDNKIYDANVDLKILFTFHNFKKGIIYVKYDCETFDKNNERLYGSNNIFAKWHIEKKNGNWTVVRIDEKP